jgi:glycosyltransferase involved in cell wall biosynthesis
MKEIYMLHFLRKSDSIITFSEIGKNFLINKKISSESIFVAPNTIDTSRNLQYREQFKTTNEVFEFKAKLGLEKNDFVILFSGRINRLKKLDHAISAIHIIAEYTTNVKLIIIGDGEDFSAMKKFANDLIPKNAFFLGEIYDPLILAKIFSLSSLFLMPQYVGLSIVHAFSFGLPIITEDAENHGPEIQFLQNGYNGYLTKENNINDLADKILYLINNPSKLSIMSQNALKTSKDQANIDKMTDQMYNAFCYAIKSKGQE